MQLQRPTNPAPTRVSTEHPGRPKRTLATLSGRPDPCPTGNSPRHRKTKASPLWATGFRAGPESGPPDSPGGESQVERFVETASPNLSRSEERRVGKECRSRW